MKVFNISRNILLSILGLLAIGTSSASAIEIGVSPPRIEVEINGKNRTQAINIINLSSEPVELKAYVHTWKMGQDNRLEVTESNEQSLDQWMVFTPARFTIPPRHAQTVRFAIRPKVKPTSGEHRAVLYIEEIPKNEDNQKVVTVGRVGVVIYGYAGDVKRVGVVNSVNVDAKTNGVTAAFDISSSGNAHVRLNGQYAVWSAASYPGASATKLMSLDNSKAKLPDNILEVADIQLPPVLAGDRRLLLLPLSKKLPPGNYVLDINGNISGVAIDKGIPFTVPGKVGTTQPTIKPTASTTRK
ncbi:molecular chaperone [Scytonema sp. NUACC26]|uniref:fimbrial biogenesis chaperone n=1 Tax=Scytonema sp. NUACC26 TaxID=3140176 RepID=UPI0034DBFD7E